MSNPDRSDAARQDATLRIAVAGGGAAGFFAAISCKQHFPSAQVTLLEKSNRLLAKVKISGGGRCNVTHACLSNAQLVKRYPRGGAALKKSFERFSVKDTIHWFESRGVRLKTESDNRMFPVSDNSQTIIDCLMREAQRLGVQIRMQAAVQKVIPQQGNSDDRFHLLLAGGETLMASHVIIATGGNPKPEAYEWLRALGHAIEPPVPSLFTFNLPDEPVRALQGVSVENALVSIEGIRQTVTGPLLITHWGFSGPAVLQLSSLCARLLHERNYHFAVAVGWTGVSNETQVRAQVNEIMQSSPAKTVGAKNPFLLPARLWLHLLEKKEIAAEKTWGALSGREINRLVNVLTHDVYKAEGKTTFKEEFVTCGGVSLREVEMQTMESRKCPGIFFAGEALDIDAVTGGFNFQAAWTTGFIAGKLGR